MLTYHALCDNDKLVKPTKSVFIVRYWKDSGIFFLTSNRRLTRFQSSAKKFSSIDSAKAFAFLISILVLLMFVSPMKWGFNYG